MLKVKLVQLKNVVAMKVLEQSEKDTERLRNDEICLMGITFTSENSPEIINPHKVYFRGDLPEYNELYTCYDFTDETKAQDFITNLTHAIRKYNIKYQIVNDKEKEKEEINTFIIE